MVPKDLNIETSYYKKVNIYIQRRNCWCTRKTLGISELEKMSLPRPSGLKIPSKIGKPSGLPQMKSGIPAPGPTLKAQSPELPEPPPPVDDFIIGDRVWVSGTKPGYIAFLGETRFAAGEWAGVVLDEPVGKNDGAVQGARYFQCPPNRGVFSKISKLSRTPGRMAMTTPVPRQDDMLSESDLNMRATNGTNSTLTRNRPTTPRGTLSGTRMSSGSTSSLNKSVSPATSTPNLTRQTPVKSPGFKVGDRVLVSGTKPGTLRYMGPADFAKGEWVGVELDEKLGKNDGAVAGKRYFDCQPMFGLFAPVHKVTRLPGPGFAGGTPQTRSGMSTSMRLTRERSGSQESISSLSSTASSVSRSRVRLGVTSLNNQAKTSQRPSTLNVSATTSALQKALKEKEEHIEQLLRERDLERAEVARAAAQIDDTENQLTRIKTERERFQGEVDESVLRMQDVIQSLEQKNHELNEKLEDEKRKVEDLQFQIEEEMLSKDDVMASTGVDETKLHELEKDLKRQKEKAEKTTQELASLKTKYEQQVNLLKSSEETATTYLDQMEELTHKLSQAENKIRTFESSRLEEGAKTSQVSMDLADKSAKVKELEDLIDSRNKELAHLHIRLGEVEEDLKTSNSKRERLQETCDSLTNRLSASDQAAEKMNAEILDLRNQVGDLQREVQANIERNEQLTDEKNKQELQLDDLMKNSGDSSERLSMLGQQIKDKTRKLEALQANLSSSTQKWAKLNEQFEQLQQEKEKEKISITCKYEETITALKIQLEDMQNEAEKSKTKMKKMSEDFEKDKEDTINRKVDEINELKKQLQHNVDELSKQEIQTQAHREVLDQMTLEKESFKFEKEKVEKHLKRVEEEKEAMNHELIQAKVETSKIQSKWAELTSEKDNYREQLEDMKTEQEKINKARQQLTKQWEDSSSEKQALGKEKDKLSTELLEAKASLQQRDIQIEELHKKIEILNSESSEQKAVLEKLSNEAATTSTLQTQMDEMGMKVTGLEEELKQSQAENDSMRAQLEFYNLLAEEKNRLENQNNDLNRKLAEMEQSHSKQMDKVHAEKDALQGETDNMTGLVKKQEEELDTQRKQIINLKNENSSIVTYKTTTQSLEKERLELQDRIVRLEALLAESKANANVVNNMDTSENSVITRLKEEKLTAEQQVEFLNSVIVDLQSKNEKLKIRLDAMETGVVNGDSSQAMEIVSPNKRVAPRLFCDICDEFDKHDTDDCPLQAMSDSPPPSINHGDRKSTRPYCDTCEVFGHWTEECDDEQTF
ncbi:hypothetical protein ScPMuIL_007204 [Solemya velum]